MGGEWSLGELVTLSIDDGDAAGGGCTTHLSSLIAKRLLSKGARLADYPLLVRLNPGIPWKTRGNAAVVLRLWGVEPGVALEEAEAIAYEYSGWRREPGKGVGVVVVQGDPWRREVRTLYRRALTGVVPVDQAVKAVERLGGVWRGGRGVVGAAAAVAALAPGDDYTWELVAYRKPELWGEARCVDRVKALRVERSLPPCVFNNIDLEGGLAAAPRGSDPVLAGFRGDCAWALAAYSEALCEEPHFWALFRSNQHTDSHVKIGMPRPVAPYNYVTLKARVASSPVARPGGHVAVKAEAREPSGPERLANIELLFFRESKPLGEVARRLAPGDIILVQGSVRTFTPSGEPAVAVDKMTIVRVAPRYAEASPTCPRCGRRMKSAGRGKGFKCPSCGFKSATLSPIRIPLPPPISPGEVAPREGRLRHLTAPPGRRVNKPFQTPAEIRDHQAFSWGPNPPSKPPG